MNKEEEKKLFDEGHAHLNNGRRSDAIDCWFKQLSIVWNGVQDANEKEHPLNSSDLDCPDYHGSIQPYILCSTPRCGSTLLCDLFSQSGVLGVPHEYLNISSHGLALINRLGIDLTNPNLARTYLDTLKHVRTTPNGIFSIQAHFHHFNCLLNPPLLNEVFPKAIYVQLFRRNRIAQAVSFAIANQTQQWDSTKEKLNEPTYNAELIDQCISQIFNQETEWTYFFQVNNIEPHTIYYEDLIEDSKSICREFLKVLKIETDFDFNIDKSKFGRQSSQLNMDWIKRYRSERGIPYG